MHSKCKSQSFGSYDRRIVFAKSECAFDCSNDRGGSARFDKSAFWWWVTRLLAVIDSSSVVWCCFACNCKSLSHSLSLSVCNKTCHAKNRQTNQTNILHDIIHWSDRTDFGRQQIEENAKKSISISDRKQTPTTNHQRSSEANSPCRKKKKREIEPASQ